MPAAFTGIGPVKFITQSMKTIILKIILSQVKIGGLTTLRSLIPTQ